MKQNTKKIVKYFNLLAEKTLFKLRNKTNYFFVNLSKISNFNKSLIAFISLLFFYLFYLSVPTTYNKVWVQNTIEDKLLKEFDINFSISSDISYNILPKPHFLIRNSKIFKDNIEKPTAFGEIKKLRIFIDQKNFLNKDNMNILSALIEEANFSLKRNDFKFLNSIINRKLSSKKINIKKSNIFFKDNYNETVSIIKIAKALLFYDNTDLTNLFNLKGEVFNIPFSFNLEKKVFSSGVKKINFNAKKLKLNISNETTKKTDNLTKGINIISTLNSKIYTQYDIKDKIVSFESDNSRVKNSNFYYEGKLSLNPFDLILNINLDKYKHSNLFNENSIFLELIKTKLLFNQNISTKISINSTKVSNDAIFNSIKMNFNIINGNINFDQTKFINNKIGMLEMNNSNLIFKDSRFILKTDMLIDIQNSDKLYSYLQTSKKLRKPIKEIIISLEYDVLTSQVKINALKIDDIKAKKELVTTIENFLYYKDNNPYKTKRMLNKLLSIYFG